MRRVTPWRSDMTTDDLHSFKPDDQRRKWDQRYSSGSTPWDTGITPPEVVRFWREHSPPPRGLAVDIGCGPGTNVAYLAALGLRVIGVDVSGLALRTAPGHVQLARAASDGDDLGAHRGPEFHCRQANAASSNSSRQM